MTTSLEEVPQQGAIQLSMIGGGGGFTHLNTIEEEKHET
jgi:hypothetical protein